jgi:dCTP deaminase
MRWQAYGTRGWGTDVLSDRQIVTALQNGHIQINPFHTDNLQPVSYDVHLARYGLATHYTQIGIPLDLGEEAPRMQPIEFYPRHSEYRFILQPHQFVLGALIESIGVTRRYAARLDGKSTLARAGLLVHVTAGLADPGWSGPLTVELANLSCRPIRLWEEMLIAQVTFEELTVPVRNLYGSRELNSHYVGSTGVQGSAGLASSILGKGPFHLGG